MLMGKYLEVYSMKIYRSMTTSELGTLWTTYQEKTLIMRVLEFFISHSEDNEAKRIMEGLLHELDQYVNQIINMLNEEDIPTPVGFTDKDVNFKAPKLFNHGFDVLIVRTLKEISMGMYTLHLNMAYRDDVITLYKNLTSMTQEYYKKTTEYLLNNSIITRPPFALIPEMVEFITDMDYLNGTGLFHDKRPLNTVEAGYIYQGVETNLIGIELMRGFAQCIQDKEVKKHFENGKNLAKKIVETYSELLIQEDIQLPASRGMAVDSTIAPFSPKLMLYCSHLLSGFGLAGNSFGSIFSLRNDIILKSTSMAKDVLLFNREGTKVMIEKGWMEEPPKVKILQQNDVY